MKTEKQFGMDVIVEEETIDINQKEVIDVDPEILKNFNKRLEENKNDRSND